jgi:signal peptide peptidase SppA
MKKINEAAFLKPWAMKEDVVTMMRDIVVRHLSGEKLSPIEIASRTEGKKEAPPYEVIGGTAHIAIYGVISKRMSWIQQLSSSGVSVLEIEKNLRAAMDDPKVERILLDIDSPGGSSDGVAELSDLIFSMRGQKEITAFANGQMCSAAYWIGSAASQVYSSSGAMVGSIGVYAVVDDYTHANWQAGIKTEVIKAGKNKAAGHPDKPFTQEDRAAIQTEVNMVYDLFVESVARNRGMSVDDVLSLATGDIFIGKGAVENRLVDGIKTFGALLNSPAADNSKKAQIASAAPADLNIKDSNKTQPEEGNMELKVATVDNVKAENKAVAEALIAEGKAAGIEEGKTLGIEAGKKLGIEEGKIAGETAAKTAETARVAKIMESMPPLMEPVALAAIKDGKTPEEAKDGYLKAMKSATPASPGANADPNVPPAGTLSIEEQCKKDWETNPQLSKDWASLESYTGYARGVKKGRIKEARKQ